MMDNPITSGEFVSLLAGIAVAVAVFLAGSEYSQLLVKNLDGLGWLLSYALLGFGLSSFAGVFLGMAVAAWRYKIIAGVWSLFVLMGFGIRELVLSGMAGFWPFVGSTFRFAVLMIGCLVSLILWTKSRDNHISRRQSFKLAAKPGSTENPPRSPYLIQTITLLSIPLLYIGIVMAALVTIGISAILIILLMESPRIPVILLVASILAPVLALVGAVMAIDKAVAPKPGQVLGILLKMESLPVLSGIINDVCGRVGTKVPDHVVLLATPEFFVAQGNFQTWDGEINGRILAIGNPAARDLSTTQFKAILAHEFAHFSGRDTAYSATTSRVFGSIGASVKELLGSTSGSNRLSLIMRVIQLPSIKFLVTFYEYLLSVSMIVSRRRELRADWIAARNFGKDAFVNALKHVAGVGMHFPGSVHTVEISVASEVFAAYSALMQKDETNIGALVDQQMQVSESEFSSHPSLVVRINSIPDAFGQAVDEGPDFQAELIVEEDRLANLFGDQILQIQARIRARKEAAAPKENTPEAVPETD